MPQWEFLAAGNISATAFVLTLCLWSWSRGLGDSSPVYRHHGSSPARGQCWAASRGIVGQCDP